VHPNSFRNSQAFNGWPLWPVRGMER